MAKRPYDSQYWRQVIRPTVFARDNYECQVRGSTKCTGRADLPHHLVDWKDGGDWYSLDNLVACCSPCNKAEGNRRATRALHRERHPTTVTPSRDW